LAEFNPKSVPIPANAKAFLAVSDLEGSSLGGVSFLASLLTSFFFLAGSSFLASLFTSFTFLTGSSFLGSAGFLSYFGASFLGSLDSTFYLGASFLSTLSTFIFS